MTQSFTTHSMLDDGQLLEITLGTVGVIFRTGAVDSPKITMPRITCSYDESVKMLEAALEAIRNRKNG